MAECRAEFLVEPFTEGVLGPHVEAAIGAVKRHAVDSEVGAFGTTIEGRCHEVMATIDDVVTSAIGAGATRVTVNLTATPTG